MGLVMFGLIASDMWIEVESFLMISVDDATNGVFEIGSTVGLQGSFIEIILVLCVGQRTGVGLEFFDIFLYFFTPFLLPSSLLLKFTFTDISS